MIYWYMQDNRFSPGTVADHDCIRLTLNQVKKDREVTNNWRLYLSIRTYKADGVKDDLKRAVKVAEFKKCSNLEDAQIQAEKWFNQFKIGIIS